MMRSTLAIMLLVSSYSASAQEIPIEAMQSAGAYIQQIVSISGEDNINKCKPNADKMQMVELVNDDIVFWYQLAGCGGGNHYEEYLMVLSNQNNKWISTDNMLIGQDWNFVGDSLTIYQDNSVLLTGKYWKENDPHCCPSGRDSRLLLVNNHKLQILFDY